MSNEKGLTLLFSWPVSICQFISASYSVVLCFLICQSDLCRSRHWLDSTNQVIRHQTAASNRHTITVNITSSVSLLQDNFKLLSVLKLIISGKVLIYPYLWQLLTIFCFSISTSVIQKWRFWKERKIQMFLEKSWSDYLS